jgi:hypothetical protein
VSICRQVWCNFKAFFESQLFWTGITAVIALVVYEYYKGHLSGSFAEKSWSAAIPLFSIGVIFLVVNVGQAIFRAEWKASKKIMHDEHRAERKAELEKNKPPVHKPNLQFRRVFRDKVFVGHEIGGHSHDAWFLEIGNELTECEIGTAKEIRAHISYLDEKGDVFHRFCPARWGRYQPIPIVKIQQGESRDLILATYDKGSWTSDLFSGVAITKGKKLEVRLIDPAGEDVLDKILTFELRTDRFGEISCITKI